MHGDALSSVAMALKGIGKTYNPLSLNTWLQDNYAYVYEDVLVWEKLTPLGLTYLGKYARSKIQQGLSSGYVVIVNVQKGLYWALATGIDGTRVYVNDPATNAHEFYDLS